MARPKNSTISRRKNLSRMVTHKRHRATDNRAPEEAKRSGNVDEYTEEGCIWVDGDGDELPDDAQHDVWSISSSSSSITILGMQEIPRPSHIAAGCY